MFRRISIVFAAIAALALPAAAQETRVAPEGHTPPAAGIEQLDWLVGQWIGEGIGGAPAMESWLPPTGNTMVGTFVQENADGAIMFSEHMYILPQDGSLALKIKHFNADLTGWEEKGDMLTFRLVAIEECAAYFNGLTLRCDGKDGLVAAVRMQSDEPEPQELVFRFNRVGKTARTVCQDAMTTLDHNQCYADMAAKSDARRARYFEAAVARQSEALQNAAASLATETSDPDSVAQMRASEAAFEAYRDAECGAVWESWKSGTIRTVMSLGCRIELGDRRTHTIWQNWLTYMDSTPPVLPEPEPTL